MKHLGSLENTQEARVALVLSCSPNFPRASYLDERTLTYEPIVKYNSLLAVFLSVVFRTFTLLFFFLIKKGRGDMSRAVSS